MNIIDIPKPMIDIMAVLNCHEFAIGETIPSERARNLLNDLEDYFLYMQNSDSLPEEEITGNLTVSDILQVQQQLLPILEELSEDNVDRLALTYRYREVYGEIIDCIFSEKLFDELTEEEVNHLNFIPITDGYILPVCFRKIYDDNLTVYRRYTDEEMKFGDIGYNDHDGVFFDYYYKLSDS